MGGGGGNDGGADAGMDAGTDAGPPPCSLVTCGTGQECRVTAQDAGRCEESFSGVTLLAPDGGVYGPDASVAVVAQLVLRAGFVGGSPPATLEGVLTGGMTQAVTLRTDGGLLYRAQVGTATLTGGQYTVSVGGDGGVVSGRFEVDRTPPNVSVRLELPSYDGGTATFRPVDSSRPAAVRRDARVGIVVTSSDMDILASSLAVAVTCDAGHVWDAGVGTACDAGLFCRRYELDVAGQPLAAFSAGVEVRAQVADAVGNVALASPAGFEVTRWKWAVQVAPNLAIEGSPAIGDGGTLYVPMTAPGTGGLFAVAPNASVVPLVQNVTIRGSPVVARTNTSEFVGYPSASGTGGGISSVGGSTCGSAATENVTSLAVLSDGLATARLVGVSATTATRRLMAVEPSIGCAESLPSVPPTAFPANVVVAGSVVHYPSGSGRIQSWQVGSTSLGPEIIVGAGTVYGVSLVDGGANIAGGGGGAGVGRLFVVARDGGTVSGLNNSTHVSGVAVGATSLFAVVQDNNESGVLARFDLSGNVTGDAGYGYPFPTGRIPGATTPVLGWGERVYQVSSEGHVLSASQQTLVSDWRSPSPMLGEVVASPTLDCNRERSGTSTGVLYFGTTQGWLVAYVVDSPGLDPTAQWAKYQHDARNTGNVSVPITCP